MRRRTFIAGLSSVAAAPAAAVAQGAQRPRRIKVIRPGRRPADESDLQITGIADTLRALGHVDGRNVVIDQRFAEGAVERLPSIIQEMLRDDPDVLVTVGGSPTLAARAASTEVPIVMFANVDPIRLGLIDTLGRPTGNITGVLIAPDGTLAAKRLELLREATPGATRFALLAPLAEPSFANQIRDFHDAAARMGVTLAVVDAGLGDYRPAFDAMVQAGAQALVVGAHTSFVGDRRKIIDLAEHHRLPAIYEWPEQVRDGGLMSYGASLTERYQRLAAHIDRILKGAKPRDLPFEQPASLRTVVNLRTARSIGLTLPDAFLARADEVIE